jgi:hypothetical protein
MNVHKPIALSNLRKCLMVREEKAYVETAASAVRRAKRSVFIHMPHS